MRLQVSQPPPLQMNEFYSWPCFVNGAPPATLSVGAGSLYQPIPAVSGAASMAMGQLIVIPAIAIHLPLAERAIISA